MSTDEFESMNESVTIYGAVGLPQSALIYASQLVSDGKWTLEDGERFVTSDAIVANLSPNELPGVLALVDLGEDLLGSNQAHVACCLTVRLAETLLMSNRWAEGELLLEVLEPQLRKFLKSPDDAARLAQCCTNRVIALARLNRQDDSLAACDRALALISTHELHFHEAACWLRRGELLFALGRIEEASSAWRQAMSTAIVHGPANILFSAFDRHSHLVFAALQDIDLHELHKCRTTEERDALNATLDYLFEVLYQIYDLGKFNLALSLWERLLNTSTKSGLFVTSYFCRFGRAEVLRGLGRHREAAEEYTSVMQVLGEFNPAYEGLCMMNAGNAFNDGATYGVLTDENHETAIAAYKQALSVFERLGREQSIAFCRYNLGNAYSRLKDFARASEAYAEAFRFFDESHDSMRASNCAMNLASSLTTLGRDEEAFSAISRVDIALLDHGPLTVFYSVLADIWWKRGDHDRSLENQKLARQMRLRALSNTTADEHTLEFVHEFANVVDRSVSRALECGKREEAFIAVQEGKAILARMGNAERLEIASSEELTNVRDRLAMQLRTGLDHDAVDQKTEEYLRVYRVTRQTIQHRRDDRIIRELPKFSEIQSQLPDQCAIVDLWRTEDGCVRAFLMTRSHFSVEQLSFPMEDEGFVEHCKEFWDSVRNPFAVTYHEVLDDLDAFVCAPLRTILRKLNVRCVYLVPHGLFHGLPLHAARRWSKGKPIYFCEEFDVAYLPSSSLLHELPIRAVDGDVLSFSNPERGTTFSLPFLDGDGDRLRAIFGNGRYFSGNNARLAETVQWNQASLLHFGCHGIADRRCAIRSHLRLSDDVLLAHDVMVRRENLRPGAMVFLNACQSAERDWRAVNENVGLATAFLHRGASFVFATHWSVLDLCASMVVEEFWRIIASDGTSPAEALRRGVQSLRECDAATMAQRIEETRQRFPPDQFPYEAAKLSKGAALVCTLAGDLEGTVRNAREAASIMTTLNLDIEAELLSKVVDKADTLTPAGNKCFDNPLFWGAFHLIGKM